MIKITLKDLVYIIPDLINLFLSGFIFITVYNWLNNKETNISLTTIWSLFISFLVKSIYAAIHSIILKNIEINYSFKILIYSLTGLILAFICTYIKRFKYLQKLLYQTNNKSINDDIFEDIIDYKKKTLMNVYIKSSNVYYIGRFSFREEKGLNSWIILVDYYRVDKETNKTTFDPDAGNLKSSVAINLRDVERIELIYEENSEVWKRLYG